MKTIIKILGAWAAVAIGVNAGNWLWDEVIEEKVDNFRGYLKDRKAE